MNSKITVEMSREEAQKLRDEWRQEMLQYRLQADELEKKIAGLDAKLSSQLPLISGTESSHEGRKRRKGENFQMIKKYLASVLASGATMTEIAQRTGISISSCTAVFERHEKVFYKSTGGFWHIKPAAIKVEN